MCWAPGLPMIAGRGWPLSKFPPILLAGGGNVQNMCNYQPSGVQFSAGRRMTARYLQMFSAARFNFRSTSRCHCARPEIKAKPPNARLKQDLQMIILWLDVLKIVMTLLPPLPLQSRWASESPVHQNLVQHVADQLYLAK